LNQKENTNNSVLELFDEFFFVFDLIRRHVGGGRRWFGVAAAEQGAVRPEPPAAGGAALLVREEIVPKLRGSEVVWR